MEDFSKDGNSLLKSRQPETSKDIIEDEEEYEEEFDKEKQEDKIAELDKQFDNKKHEQDDMVFRGSFTQAKNSLRVNDNDDEENNMLKDSGLKDSVDYDNDFEENSPRKEESKMDNSKIDEDFDFGNTSRDNK